MGDVLPVDGVGGELGARRLGILGTGVGRRLRIAVLSGFFCGRGDEWRWRWRLKGRGIVRRSGVVKDVVDLDRKLGLMRVFHSLLYIWDMSDQLQ